MKFTPKAKRFTYRALAVVLIVVVIAILVNLAWQNQLRDVTSLKTYLNDLRDVALALTQIAALLLVSGFIVMLTIWLSRSEGTIVLPFQNATGDAKYDGRGISDSLIAELQRIRQIHETKFEGIQLEREKITLPAWKPNTEDVSASVADIGAIGIGDTTISVGKLLTTLKRMWPFGEPGSLITGSIQKYGSVCRLVARMEDHNSIRTWTVTREIKQDSEITYLIRDLAYQIVNGLSPEITASSEGFEYFSESLYAYSVYKRTSNADDLLRAENGCLDAYKHDQNYIKLASLFYNFGVEEYNRNDYTRAVLMLEPATKLQSNGARGFLVLSYAYSNLNRDEDALNAIQHAVELDPKDVRSYTGLGYVYASLGRMDESTDSFNHAKELDPKDASPHNGLGWVFYLLGRTEDALIECQHALQLDPKDTIPHIGLGTVYSALGRTDEAIAAYQRAIELNAADSAPHYFLGIVFHLQKEYEKALNEYTRAIELDPKDGVSRVRYASVLRKLGREVEASEQLKIGREVLANAREYNRAWIESICGNTDEALTLLKAALEKKQRPLAWVRRDPDFDNIRTDPRFVALVGAADEGPSADNFSGLADG